MEHWVELGTPLQVGVFIAVALVALRLWRRQGGAAAARQNGVDALRSALRTSAQALRPIAQIRVPVGDGRLLASLHRDSEVMAEVQVDGVVEVTARVEAPLLGRLRRAGIAVDIVP